MAGTVKIMEATKPAAKINPPVIRKRITMTMEGRQQRIKRSVFSRISG